jgi:NADH:ubiquinone oxidoreductase subunit 5 (subunit L)/multisubunit Na+/H+ antiporter MnhA subunit
MFTLIIFIPLLSAFVSGVFGRIIGEKGAGFYTSASIVFTSLLS